MCITKSTYEATFTANSKVTQNEVLDNRNYN